MDQISIHAPAKGATLLIIGAICPTIISIHAPAKGATPNFGWEMAPPSISIHAPAKGATNCAPFSLIIPLISIHAPAKGATQRVIYHSYHNLNFNPRSREGSDKYHHILFLYILHISIHAPAKGATSGSYRDGSIAIFQSTLPRRERHLIVVTYLLLANFNPRSREGSDGVYKVVVFFFVISIHAPAKGAT